MSLTLANADYSTPTISCAGKRPSYFNRVEECLASIPHCRPLDHSMALSIDQYVFQKLPKNEIADVLFAGGRVEVHGIYPDHLEAVLVANGYNHIRPIEFSHNRSLKQLNFVRPRCFLAEKNNIEILIFAVIPGRDYVRHYATMIRHFVSTLTSSASEVLKVFRYPEAEAALCDWTSLDKNLINSGETVVLGYIHEFSEIFRRHPGLRLTKALRSEFYHTYQFQIGDRQITFLGVVFSYWGDMSALIATRLCELGASEIIYSAKLGSLTSESDLYTRIYSPSKFVVLDYLSVQSVATKLRNGILEKFPSLDTGFHVSVPTVLEEDYKQRTVAQLLNASSIDNEISQMAFSIQKFNTRNGANVAFSALHFATDYLRKEDERSLKTHLDLSNNRTENARGLKKNAIQTMAEILLSYFGVQNA